MPVLQPVLALKAKMMAVALKVVPQPVLALTAKMKVVVSFEVLLHVCFSPCWHLLQR